MDAVIVAGAVALLVSGGDVTIRVAAALIVAVRLLHAGLFVAIRRSGGRRVVNAADDRCADPSE